MLQGFEKKKIIKGVESNLPEFIKKEKIIEEIKTILNELVYDNLTKNELEYFKLYPSKCRVGLYIELSKLRLELDEDERKNFPILTYYSSDYYRQNIRIYFPGTNNDIVNTYYNKSFWEELKLSDKKNFEKLKDLTKNFIELSNKVHNKVSTLKEVLDLPDITLTSLKKYYPELYKFAKQ